MSDKVKMLEGGSFKVDETTRYIKFEFVDDDNEPFTPLPQHSYIARIGNSTGYLGDYPVAISGHAFILSSEKLIDLGPGNYELEIWEFYQDNQGNKQTTIYPSPDSTVLFSITKNITSSTGEQIEKISFEKLVDQITKNVQLNVKALQGYSKAEMDSKLQNYVTKDQLPDTSNFVTNEQLPEVQLDIDRRTITINGNTIGIPNSVDLSAYAKKNEVPAITYDPDTKSLTINGTKVELPGNVDLSNYYTKSEVDNRIAQAATSGNVDLTGYLKISDANNDFAKKTDLPDMTNVATKNEIPTVAIDTAGRTISVNGTSINIPDNVDLSDYVKTDQLPKVSLDLSKRIISINGQSINIPNAIDLSGFYTKQEIDDKLANAVSDGRVDLTGYLKVNDADAKYATKAELPDLSSYALKSDVPSIAGLAKESDIPQISLDVATRTLTLGTTSIKIPDTVDLSGYATKSEIPQVTMNLSSRTITISGQSITVPQSVDLADYYTKGEVDTKLANAQTGGQVDLSNYLTVRDADKKYAVEESVKSLFAKRGIDVTEHGLVGDGKTDNTEAFKKLAVWADQQPMKMTLWFPAGTYLWSSTVQFNNMVELAGTESSWLKYIGTGTGLLLGKDGITEAEHINYRSFTVRNLCFTGGEDSDYLIEFNNFVTQSRVTGCQFHNAGGRNHGTEKQFCIYFNDDAWDGRVEHNQFDVTKDGGQRQFVGMSEYGNSRVMVNHNLVTSLSGFGTAIYLNGLNNQVMANKIEGFQTPVRLGGAADDAIVAFNYFEKNGASKPSACVEIGDPDATNTHSPKHIYIAYNYAGLHNKSGKMYSYLVGPSSPHALLRNVLIEGNFINGADWTANPAVMGYVVNENNVTGQSDNHANNNYLSIGIKDILDTRTNDGSTNVREPWIVMDSPSKEVNIDLSDYAKLSQLANYVKRAELSDYAKKSDIPSVDGFATQSQLSNYVQQAVLNDYAKKTDIPDLSGYLTSSAAAITYATNASVDSKISSVQPDLTDINNGIAVNKANIDKVASDLNAVSASASATQAYVSSQSNTLSTVANMAKQGSNTATAALQKAIDAMSTAESAVSAQSSATIDYEMIVKRVDDDIAGKILTMKFGGGK